MIFLDKLVETFRGPKQLQKIVTDDAKGIKLTVGFP